ncbi:MAG: dehydrogenase, partial [Myxococcota bacterium]
ARVTLIDVNPDRADLARDLGVAFATPDHAPGDQDVVIEASGSPGGLATALGLAGVEATVVVASWYGEGAVPVPLGGAFHSRRLTVRSSQVGRVPPARAPRFDFRRRLGAALALLAGAPELDRLVDAEVPFEQATEVLPRITGPGGDSLCLRITYRGIPCSV